jgi:hypothetical protein
MRLPRALSNSPLRLLAFALLAALLAASPAAATAKPGARGGPSSTTSLLAVWLDAFREGLWGAARGTAKSGTVTHPPVPVYSPGNGTATAPWQDPRGGQQDPNG